MTALSIDRDTLLSGLSALQPAQRKTLLPILECVHLRHADNVLSLTATDLDLMITRRLPVEPVLVPLETAVMLNDLTAIITEMPSGPLDLDMSAQGKLLIRSGRARITLTTMPTAEFPPQRAMTYQTTPMPWEPLARAVSRVIWAASLDDRAQALLMGVSWRAQSGALYLAATNRYQLAATTLAVPLSADANMVIPARALQAALKLFAETPSVRLGLDTDGSYLALASDAATVVIRLLDGSYPDYERLFPAAAATEVIVSLADLISVTRRVAVLTTRETRRVEYAFTPELVTATVRTPDRGEAIDDLALSAWVGEALTLGLNADLMLACLAAVGTAQVRLALHGPRGAMMLTAVEPETPERWRALIMPLNDLTQSK
jgi:DNA polymerase-3 subunit beta